MTETLKELKAKLKEATQNVKDIEKRKRSSTFGKLSQYSKDIIEKEHQELVGKQFDIIEKITDLVVSGKATQQQAEAVVISSTK